MSDRPCTETELQAHIADAAHRLRRPKATYVRETVVAHAQKVLAAVEAPVTRAEGAAR
jgi:predicted DNA-binding protein